VTVSPDARIGEFIDILVAKDIGAVAVCDAGGGIIGMVTERDLVRGLSEAGAGVADILVRDLMSPDVIACNSGDTIQSIREMMAEGHFRHMPVVEEGELVGMISMRDIFVQLTD